MNHRKFLAKKRKETDCRVCCTCAACSDDSPSACWIPPIPCPLPPRRRPDGSEGPPRGVPSWPLDSPLLDLGTRERTCYLSSIAAARQSLSVAINSCRSKRNRLDSSMLGDYVIITAEWILRRPSSKSRSHDFLLLKNGKIPARRSTTENVRAKESSYPSPLLSYYIGYCYVSCYTEGRKNVDGHQRIVQIQMIFVVDRYIRWN